MTQRQRDVRPQALGTVSRPAFNVISWVATNPFGEAAAYLLVIFSESTRLDLREQASNLGLKALDAGGEMTIIGTDALSISLQGPQVAAHREGRIWFTHPVADTWTAAAIARRYIVLVMGDQPWPPRGRDSSALSDNDPVSGERTSARDVSSYLRDHDNLFTGLVRVQLRMTSD
ncbi:hypothetical protein [Actinomyces viscosus]|uniref:hypothetical protein n=1 Tax=Actinomyces viscosus TaxID=1656 RepID=UPI0028EA58D6|nr:hypothetical protein [Actinomyces viscosus]